VRKGEVHVRNPVLPDVLFSRQVWLFLYLVCGKKLHLADGRFFAIFAKLGWKIGGILYQN